MSSLALATRGYICNDKKPGFVASLHPELVAHSFEPTSEQPAVVAPPPTLKGHTIATSELKPVIKAHDQDQPDATANIEVQVTELKPTIKGK